MGKITTGIENGIKERCRCRNEKIESCVKSLVKVLPLLSSDKQDDYDMVYDWLMDLRDDIYCNPAITSEKNFYLNRIIELQDSVFQGRTPKMNRDVADMFEQYAAQLLNKDPVAENHDTYPEVSTGTVISFLDVVGGYNQLLGKDDKESITKVFRLLEERGYVTTENMKAQLRKDIKKLLKDFDSSTFLAEMKTVCSRDERITALLTQKKKLLGTLICSAMAEYVLLKIIIHVKLSENKHINRCRASYLNQFLKRICCTAWEELIRKKIQVSETADDTNGTIADLRDRAPCRPRRRSKKGCLNIEEIKSCFDIMDDRAFLKNLQNDFSFWTKITELIMKPEYYRTALSNYEQPNKKKRTEEILDECEKNGTVPDNEVIKSLVCAAVNKMTCLSPYDLKEYERSKIYGPFDTTINQAKKEQGWFNGDIHTLPKSGSVYRDHVFTIAFALQLTVDDAESLLMDGAKLEGFDSKCILEAIYQYALNWKLSYADARKMWLKCIEMMILYNDDAAGFCSGDEVVQDKKYTGEIREDINEYYMERNEEKDNAFLNMLAGCSKLLSIEELSEWILWKYMETCGFDEKIQTRLVQWIGQLNYDEILNKLDEMKNTIETAVHKRRTFETTRIFIQSLLEKTYRNYMRVIRVEYAYFLYNKLRMAWANIVNDIQSLIEIKNTYISSHINFIEESAIEGKNARDGAESINNALSELIEGKYPVTIEAFGNPLTSDILTAHENGKLPVTRTDILRYSFWIFLLSKDNYVEYDPENAFSHFRDIANRALAECRFHQFYVRSALDRALYMCFWDESGPIEAYRWIIGRLQVDNLTEKQVEVWEASINDDCDEKLKNAVIQNKGKTYMKAIVWLSYHGVFDGKQPIWPQLAAFHLAKRKYKPDDIKTKYENDKAKNLLEIEKSIQKYKSKLADSETSYKKKIEMAQQRQNKTNDSDMLTRVEKQKQSHRKDYEKETESIRIKLEQLETEKNLWLSDEILRTRIDDEQEKCRKYTDDFINGCKEYFRRFSDYFPEWFITMEQAYPSERIEAMKKELETTD